MLRGVMIFLMAGLVTMGLFGAIPANAATKKIVFIADKKSRADGSDHNENGGAKTHLNREGVLLRQGEKHNKPPREYE